MLARASLGKESSANAKTAASKAEAQPRAREREQFLEEFTPPTFSWNISNIAMSAPGDSGRPNQGENGAPRGPARHFARPLPLPIQAKLEVGAVDDPLEQEADRVAEQVMRMPDPRATNSRTPRSSSALQEASPTELDATVQHKPPSPQVSRAASSPIGSGMTAPPIVHEVLSSPGHPLDPGTRAFMEPRFGWDFSGIRIHTDPAAAQSARDVNAIAYTAGNNIIFSSGQYAPGTVTGNHLLAHELVHVVQQGGGTGGGWARTSGTEGAVPSSPKRAASTGLIQRAPGVGAGGVGGAEPSAPSWLGRWRSKAIHVQGDIWDLKLPSMGGDTWVGPHNQLAAYIKKQGFESKLEAAHIIGNEHLEDLGSSLSYGDGPCVAAPKGVHLGWTDLTGALQAKYLGGRSSNKPGREVGRTVIGPKDVDYIYHELYRGKPELQEFARNIVREYGHPPAAPQVLTTPGGQPTETKATRTTPQDAPEGAPVKASEGTKGAAMSNAPEGGRGRKRQKPRGGGRDRKPDAPKTLGGRGTSRESQRGSLRAGKVEAVAGQRRGGGGKPANVPEPPTSAPTVVPYSPGVKEGFGESVPPETAPTRPTAVMVSPTYSRWGSKSQTAGAAKAMVELDASVAKSAQSTMRIRTYMAALDNLQHAESLLETLADAEEIFFQGTTMGEEQKEADAVESQGKEAQNAADDFVAQNVTILATFMAGEAARRNDPDAMFQILDKLINYSSEVDLSREDLSGAAASLEQDAQKLLAASIEAKANASTHATEDAVSARAAAQFISLDKLGATYKRASDSYRVAAAMLESYRDRINNLEREIESDAWARAQGIAVERYNREHGAGAASP